MTHRHARARIQRCGRARAAPRGRRDGVAGERRPHLQRVPFPQPEAPRAEPDALAGFRFYAVDALVIVVVMGREVWRQQRPFMSLDSRPALS